MGEQPADLAHPPRGQRVIVPGLIAVAAVALYVWQDGIRKCFDGERYVSRKAQPSPFHRRFHYWPPQVLAVSTWLSIVAITSSFHSVGAALMFATLPGVWFCAVNPTTVDMVSMSLAWGCSLLWPAHPYVAIALSLLSGVVHERGPVFAAVYTLSPWPLLGLLAVQWWAKRAPVIVRNDSDRFVGTSFVSAVTAHRGARDLLGGDGLLWSLRGVSVAAAWLGTSRAGWSAFALAATSRLVSTDAGRCMIWCAPPMLAAMPEIPPWVVAAHVLTFRRQV